MRSFCDRVPQSSQAISSPVISENQQEIRSAHAQSLKLRFFHNDPMGDPIQWMSYEEFLRDCHGFWAAPQTMEELMRSFGLDGQS